MKPPHEFFTTDMMMLPMRRCLSAFCGLVAVLAFSTIGLAQAPPSADAYVTNLQPGANFGNAAILPVQVGTSSYIRLDLGIIPSGSRVAKASLRLYVNAVATPGSFDVFQVENSWTEHGVTFNTAPQLGPSASGGHPLAITSASRNQFVLIDITPLAQSWIDGSLTNNGVALELVSAMGSFSFDSKESAGHEPELEIVFGNPSGTPVFEQSASSPALRPGVTTGVGLQGPDVYIDNGTALQVGANFNIDGTGTAANFNVTSGYMLNGSPILGYSAGQSLYVGLSAGPINTGASNIFIGTSAGLVNSTGANNMFVGAYSGQSNTSGSQNTFVGGLTGVSNTTGAANAFFGNSAGYNTTTGSYNMFFGVNAGFHNTIGFGNSFVGVQAGLSNVSGNENLFMGSNSGQNSNGNFNTFIGSSAGTGNTTGNNNTVIGTAAGQPLVSGNGNTILGSNAGANANPAGNNNVYLNSPGNTGDNGTMRIGDQSTQNAAYIAGIIGAITNSGVPVFVDSSGKLGTLGNTMGLVTSVFGRSGNVTPQFGDYNFGQISGVVQGMQIGGAYSQGVTFNNMANSFQGNFSGNGVGLNGVMPAAGSNNYIQNNGAPQGANFNITGSGTVGGLFTANTGMQAFNNVSNNVAIEAVDNNTSMSSAAIEGKTFNPIGAGVDGHAKASTGYSVGVQGENDSTIGAGVIGVNSTTSGQNFGVLGYTSSIGGFGVMGASPGGVGTAGSNQNCSAFGSCTLTTGIAGQFFTQTGGTLLQGLSGSSLTSLTQVFAVDSAGNFTIAGSITSPGVYSTKVTGGVQVVVDSTGHIGVATSSGRFKEKVRDMGDSSAALMKLRPVTYFYKPEYDDGSRTLQYGLIAEEVAQVYPELVAYEPDGKPYTVKYQYLATMLLNELQKEHRKVEELTAELQTQNAELKKQNEQLEQRLLRVESLLQSQINSAVTETASDVSLRPEGNKK